MKYGGGKYASGVYLTLVKYIVNLVSKLGKYLHVVSGIRHQIELEHGVVGIGSIQSFILGEITLSSKLSRALNMKREFKGG